MRQLLIDKVYLWRKKNIPFQLTILTILNLSVLSCEQREVECSLKRYDCEIIIMDQNFASLIGNDNQYKPDSISMIINKISWTTHIDSDKIVWNYAGLDYLNKVKYFLRLSSFDTDTIDFKVSRQNGECFDSFNIDTFKYNNKSIIPDTSDYQNRLVYRIIKFPRH